MRAGSDAGIFRAAPVNKIVPAFRARPRVIGNLVSRQSGARTGFDRQIVKFARRIAVGDHKLAGGLQRVKRRLRLDGQLIKREMLGGLRNRAAELSAPAIGCLAGTRVNQIEGIALEHRARDGDGRERFIGAVHAAEFLEHAIIERLHAERHAVDARRAIATKALGFNAGRIGFERDLDVGCDRPVLRDRVENGRNGRRLHQRRRAAAKEHRRDGAAGNALSGRRDLGRKGADIARLIDRGMAHMAVEVAIRTLRETERPMQIDAEGICLCEVLRVLLQDTPPRVSGMRARDATALARAAAARAFRPTTSRRRCAHGRRAGTSDRSRSLCRRAAATPACRRRGLRILRHGHRATTRRAPK